MKTVSMSGSQRGNVGKKDAKKLRKEGQVPCVLYGGKEQIHFSMDERNFSKILFTPEVFVIKIDLDGTEYETILQDIQYHPVTDKILHADFLLVFPDKPMKVSIPVKLMGTPPGVIKGGRIVQKLRKLRVLGLIKDLPDFLEVDISMLEIGSTVKISDLSYDNLALIDIPSEMVVAVKVTRIAVDEEEEEEEGEEGEGGEGAAEGEGAKPAEGEGSEGAKPAERGK